MADLVFRKIKTVLLSLFFLGYEHEAAKSAHFADAKGSGFQKGYESAEEDSGHELSSWDKAAMSQQGHGHAYNHGDWGENAAEHGKSEHEDAWSADRDDYNYRKHHR